LARARSFDAFGELSGLSQKVAQSFALFERFARSESEFQRVGIPFGRARSLRSSMHVTPGLPATAGAWQEFVEFIGTPEDGPGIRVRRAAPR
jgi:hypothetical protein